MNFPAIKKQLEKGVSFELVYRSKPIAKLETLTPNFDFLDKKFDKSDLKNMPNSLEELVENIDKYAFKTGPFNAAEEIRKERDERY